MKPRIAVALFLSAVSLSGRVALAHHTVAMTHDVSHAVALTGTITGIQWQNPHVIYHLAVPTEGNGTIDWEIESRHLQGMRQAGLDADSIKVGDTVTMHVLLALDGSHHAATASIELPGGRTVNVCTVTNNRCP